MNYILTQEQLQALLNYLGTRPYIEVAKLILSLGQLQKSPANSKKDESAKTKQ